MGTPMPSPVPRKTMRMGRIWKDSTGKAGDGRKDRVEFPRSRFTGRGCDPAFATKFATRFAPKHAPPGFCTVATQRMRTCAGPGRASASAAHHLLGGGNFPPSHGGAAGRA